MRQIQLVCDKCGKTAGVFTYSLRPVGGVNREYKGELCPGCYQKAVKWLGAMQGKPTRGRRAPMQAVDYDTGNPLEDA